MKDVAGLDVEPRNILRASVALKQPDAGPVVGIPPVREAGARHGRLSIEHYGEVVDDGVALRKDAVVTPKQAEKAGIPAEIIKEYSFNPPGAQKLVPETSTQLRKIFSI